jgi:hypothetical protein
VESEELVLAGVYEVEVSVSCLELNLLIVSGFASKSYDRTFAIPNPAFTLHTLDLSLLPSESYENNYIALSMPSCVVH